jgi:glycosyltransferase involved in cell wall biosynthesis
MAKHTVMSHRHLHIVHTEASCGWGGQEIRILEESRGMVERGHRVTLVCPPEATIYKRAEDWGIKVVPLKIGDKRWKDFWAVRKWLAKEASQIDVINTHSSTDSWLVAVANRSLGAKGVPLVRTRHISAPVKNSLANRWLYGKAVERVITTGENLRHHLVDTLGLPPQHVQSVFTGINTSRFVPGDKAEARQRLDLDMNSIWIGIVATLRSWKGHKYLLQAIAELNNPRIRLAIVGDGPQREKLHKRVVELGLTRVVHFAGNQKDVAPWLQAMDVFVLPSFANEGVSQAVMQAMSVGLPVITTPIGSSADVVKTGITGLMVPPKDAPAIAGSLRHLIDSPQEAARLGQQARAFALENCGIERMVTRMEAVFMRAAG